MVRVQLLRAESEPLAFRERFEFPAGSGGEETVSASEVEISGVVEKAGKGFVLTGEVNGRARLRCGRCLQEYEFSFSEPFSLDLLPLAEAPDGEETRLGRDELEVRFYEVAELDLAELAEEQLQLALPLKPLCAEVCLGLCPHCGADLNSGRCECPAQVDQRWAPLRSWRPA